MKILWHGIPWRVPTGYGLQTKLFVESLQQLGHEVAVNCISDQLVSQRDQGVLYLSSGPRYALAGNDLIKQHHDKIKPDCVISMVDPFVCNVEAFCKFNWFPFCMVDSDPVKRLQADALQGCIRPIAPTSDAYSLLQCAGFAPLYCPLMVDEETYYPYEYDDPCKAAREYLYEVTKCEMTESTFVACIVAANHSIPSRKNFGAAFKAWARFERDVPDSLLYVHSEIAGEQYRGENLYDVAKLYEVKNIVFAPQYEYVTGTIPPGFLNTVYNAANVLLHTARGEGFGLPLVEAQMAGCPVIAPDFGAMREVTMTGRLCSGRRYMFQPGSEQFIVDDLGVAHQLLNAVDDAATRWTHTATHDTRDKVMKYSQAYVSEHALPHLLKDIQKEVEK